MIALFLLPVFITIHTIIAIWLFKWLRHIHVVFRKRLVIGIIIAIYTYFILDMYIAALIPHGKLERMMKLIGNYWLGFTIYAAMVVGIALLIRLILVKSRFKDSRFVKSKKVFILNGLLCIVIIGALCIGGHINATRLITTDYEVNIDKSGGEFADLDVVLVADLHMGYNIGVDMINQMVDRINDCDPDVVLIGGDIFDNSYESMDDPEGIMEAFKNIKSRYGVYAVWGNHDIAETIIGGFTFPSKNKKMSDIRMDQFLEDAGIKLLRDESVIIEDSVYIFGRPDEERPGRGIDIRLTPAELVSTMDTQKPVIVLEHEPKELKELAKAGVDLHLSGHTHAGQTFPMNLTAKFSFENPYGLKMVDEMPSIVTSGVGLYGPYIRVGTKPEISNVHVHFVK